MIVPYTTRTGLRIGSRYREVYVRPLTDPDMQLIQRALLLSEVEMQIRTRKRLHAAFYIACVLITVMTILYFYKEMV